MKIASVEFLGTLVDPGAALPSTLPQVAFSGRSNVGKSSLINTILGRTRRKVAHVSGTPGKTRGLNFYRINQEFVLVDLPGFGYAKVPESVRAGWKTLVEGYLTRRDGPCAVVHLMDARRDPTDGDREMLDDLSALGIPALVAVTKVDKLSASERRARLPELMRRLELDPEQVIPLSSKTGEGRGELLDALRRLLEEEASTERGTLAASRATGETR